MYKRVVVRKGFVKEKYWAQGMFECEFFYVDDVKHGLCIETGPNHYARCFFQHDQVEGECVEFK